MILLKNYFVNTTKEVDVISILHDVGYALKEAGAQEGLVTVMVPGPGASVTIIQPLPDVVSELKEALKVFPGEGKEAKTRRKETIKVGARVKAAMLGKSLTVPVKEGKLLLGHREEIVLVDFEAGAKRREFMVQVMSEGGGGDQVREHTFELGGAGEEEY